jgi:hypothetical protein
MLFNGTKIFGLEEVESYSGASTYGFLLTSAEEVILEYKSVRDHLVFTSTRIISVDIQGFSGKKVEYFSLPYSKVSAFSVETAGSVDLDAELKLWASGMGVVEFEFLKGSDVKKLAHALSSKIV